MRLALVGILLLAACAAPQARWYDARQSPTPPAPDWFGDPLTTEASTVDDLHRSGARTVCHVRSIRPTDPDTSRPLADALRDRLKLCRDKGFDAVTLESPNPQLHRAAADLNLPVLSGPTDPPRQASTAPPPPRP